MQKCFVGTGCENRYCRKAVPRSEEHTSELQSQSNLVCRLLLEKKNQQFHNLAWCRCFDSRSRPDNPSTGHLCCCYTPPIKTMRLIQLTVSQCASACSRSSAKSV